MFWNFGNQHQVIFFFQVNLLDKDEFAVDLEAAVQCGVPGDVHSR